MDLRRGRNLFTTSNLSVVKWMTCIRGRTVPEIAPDTPDSKTEAGWIFKLNTQFKRSHSLQLSKPCSLCTYPCICQWVYVDECVHECGVCMWICVDVYVHVSGVYHTAGDRHYLGSFLLFITIVITKWCFVLVVFACMFASNLQISNRLISSSSINPVPCSFQSAFTHHSHCHCHYGWLTIREVFCWKLDPILPCNTYNIAVLCITSILKYDKTKS